MSHTPGPWVIDEQYIRAKKNARGPMLCQWGSYTVEANARLIAAAPELLAALQRLIATDDAHSTIHAPDGDDVARMVEYSAAFDNARAVIAKTIGEDK